MGETTACIQGRTAESNNEGKEKERRMTCRAGRLRPGGRKKQEKTYTHTHTHTTPLLVRKRCLLVSIMESSEKKEF